jgi:hypothetical protein
MKLDWSNSELITGDVAMEVKKLKEHLHCHSLRS